MIKIPKELNVYQCKIKEYGKDKFIYILGENEINVRYFLLNTEVIKIDKLAEIDYTVTDTHTKNQRNNLEEIRKIANG